MKLHPHFFTFLSPASCAVNIVIQLSPIFSQSLHQPPPATHSPSSSQVIQRCLSLAPKQCCVPIDLSEISLTESRLCYQPTALDFRPASPPSTSINIWTQRNCDGPAVARVPIQPASQGGGSWDVKAGVRVSGVGISGEFRKREVRYPSTLTYQGGLYYEYLDGSLVYAKVSHWGDGPNTMYGMRQEIMGKAALGVGNGTGPLNGNAAVLQEAAIDTAR